MTFRNAVKLILKHEGGYVNDPRDPGGETKYGISKRAHPELDIATLTEDQATVVYLQDYWKPANLDLLPPALALMVFDFGVNAGMSRAIPMLQGLVGADPDGKIGPATMAAVDRHYSAHPLRLVRRYHESRAAYYSGLRHADRFLDGWLKRSVMTMQVASRLTAIDIVEREIE